MCTNLCVTLETWNRFDSSIKRTQTLPAWFLDCYQGGVKTVRDENIFFVCLVLGRDRFPAFKSSLIADDSYYFIILDYDLYWTVPNLLFGTWG